jgi:hypothetical protein
MKSFSVCAFLFLSLINASFGVSECPREKASKEHVIRYLKQTSNAHDLIVGSSTIKNPKDQTCIYEVLVTYKGLNEDNKEQIFMEYFKLNDDFIRLNAPWRIYGEKVQD